MPAKERADPAGPDGFIFLDLSQELEHAKQVSNMAYDVSREMKLEKDYCHEMAMAGMLHDIGKVKIESHFCKRQATMMVEKLRYMRMHPTLGYKQLTGQGFSDTVLESILYHHENYDGSGYPNNLQGDEIPLGARILRVCDEFSALQSDRPYRKALDVETTMEEMIHKIKNFDMGVFLAFQRVVHKDG